MIEHKMKLDFAASVLEAFGEKIPLIKTSSGLFALPLTKTKQLIECIDHVKNVKQEKITMRVTNAKSNKEMASKLHRQFAHPSSEKLIRLVNNAGEQWASNTDLKEEIKRVTNECDTCKIYKKPPPRPVVGLPMATEFQETIAMDLKSYNGKLLIHIIDLCTRLSASSVIPNKNRETIIGKIFKIWISVYGKPQKILTDNGGEFANSAFLEMAEQLDITVKTTAAESPWSNGVVERHNLILADMLDKITADNDIDLDLAITWAINAKNSLYNVNGFSPFQLAIGCNPQLPSVLNGNLPALTSKPASQIVKENLNAIHIARQAFIASENSERLRRAMSHNIRTTGDVKYITGDKVYYKRSAREWHGPANVLGQDGQQVLLKHGSYYVRVHPCRLQLCKPVKSIRKTCSLKNQSSTNSDKNDDEEREDNEYNEESETDEEEQNAVAEEEQAAAAEDQPAAEEEQAAVAGGQPAAEEQVAAEEERADPEEQAVGEEHQAEAVEHQAVDEENKAVDEENQGDRQEDAESEADNGQVNNDQQLKLDIFNIKPNLKVQYKWEENDPWKTVTIHSRGGKAKGKNAHWWNTIDENGIKSPINFASIYKFRMINSVEPVNVNIESDEYIVDDILLLQTKCDIKLAKAKELKQWKERNVYTEEDDCGQECISLRWVIGNKTVEEEIITRARLVARGYEEEQDFRTDSPTCSREGVKIALACIAANGWTLNSIDIKTAFLQGKKIERTVYVRPPKEAETNKVWRLNIAVYGLADASRTWYLKIREELIKEGSSPSQKDQGIFYWKDMVGVIIGILICFVDDLLFGGTKQFENAIENLKKTFQVGTENSVTFQYIGIHLHQDEDKSITINQESYIKTINPIIISNEQKRNSQCLLQRGEVTLLRGAIGRLNWVAGITRPEISFYTCEISTRIKTAKVADIIVINKVIKFIQSTPSSITFPRLQTNTATIKLFADASYNNLPNGGSQGGFLIFITDNNHSSCPVAWNSTKVKRVAKSTLAAEALALSERCDAAFWVSELAKEAGLIKADQTIKAYTDNRSLYDAVNTTNQVSDRRLRVDISSIREYQDTNEIEVIWVNGCDQLADVLTKKGASSHKLIKVINEGKLLVNQ